MIALEQRQARAALIEQANAIVESALAAGRAMNAGEYAQVDTLLSQQELAAHDIARREQE